MGSNYIIAVMGFVAAVWVPASSRAQVPSWNNNVSSKSGGQYENKNYVRLAQNKTTPKKNTSKPAATSQIPSFIEPFSESDDKVILDADKIVAHDDTNTVEAFGHVQAKTRGKRLSADHVTYDRDSGLVTADGNAVLVQPDGSMNFADHLVTDDRLNTGVVDSFAMRLTNGAVVASTNASIQRGNRNVLTRAIYTACPICKTKKNPRPTWLIRARHAIQNEKTHTITYHDVVFEFKGVPVIWSPWFRHGDPSAKRQSGFLQPIPGHSSRLGWNARLPYMQIIDDYSDITIMPLISQYVNPVLEADYRRRFYSGLLDLDGSVTHEQLFLREGDKYGKNDWRSHLFGQGLFDINKNLRWGFGIETASDATYLYRYSIQGQALVRGLVRNSGSFLTNQLFLEGQDSNYYARVMAISFQDLLAGETRKNTPEVLPTFDGHYNRLFGPMNGQLEFDSSLFYLNRKQNRQDSGEATFNARWHGSKIFSNGLVLAPDVFVRGEYFNYQNQVDLTNTDIGNHSFGVGVGQASVDLSWPLQRSFGNLNFNIIPRANLAIANKIDANKLISNENAVGIENEATAYQLGYRPSVSDVWDGGARATLGVNFIGYLPKNTSFNLYLGKQYSTDDNPFLARYTNMDKKDGDWETQMNVQMGNNFSLSGTIGLDAKTGRVTRADVGTNLNIGKFTMTAKYYEKPAWVDTLSSASREIIITSNYKINDHLGVFANNWYDIRHHDTLHSQYGINFGDACTDYRLYYEEINTTFGLIPPSQNIKFQIAFKTLGQISDSPFN